MNPPVKYPIEFLLMGSEIRVNCYPLTKESPQIAEEVGDVFRAHETDISSIDLTQEERPNSNQVLSIVRSGLEELQFEIEGGKKSKIEHALSPQADGGSKYSVQVDGYHKGEQCILEVEGGRGGESNAIHRDLLRTMAIEDIELLVMAVLNEYKHRNGVGYHFRNADMLIRALYDSNQFEMPFQTALIGY